MRGGVVLRAATPLGTPVVVRPMPGFSKAYAVLRVGFGSLDATFPDGAPMPLGVAHFLEHKMFATPDGDVFDLYAKRGASANAYTTYGLTAYLFGCTSRFDENLATLLDTLRTMHADPAGIDREKGIIGQEIAMYDDDPGWRSHANLMAALYRDHPVRHEITGSAATIAAIDRDLLLRVHAAYYHPRNLALFVAGDVDPAAVLAAASERLTAADAGAGTGAGGPHRRGASAEPSAPASPERRQALSVTRPNVTLGIKDTPVGTRGPALVRHETLTEMALDVLFSDGGRLEAPLYREGVVDESFGAGYHADHDFAFASVGGDVDDEAAFRARLERELATTATAPVTEAELTRVKRRSVGGYLRSFDAPERAAGLLLGLDAKEATLAEALAAVLEPTPAQVTARLRELLACPRAWSVIEPRKV
ncbi:MAG: insulinase family protein [Planctomycetia bacterium]|nr:insulinase family protein [Planctomycetia bacterium]